VPLQISQSTVPALCLLSSWAINDDDAFIQAIAWLYLQKPNHAHKIANKLAPFKKAGLPGNPFIGAMAKLKYRRDDLDPALLSPDSKVSEKAQKELDARVSHRDGLLFQHISWLAAAIQYPGALKAPPHARAADKGFDGMILDVDAASPAISRLIMCEDKASIDPRPIVRKDVWRELQIIQAGTRDDEVNSSVQGLLSTLKSATDEQVEEILEAVCWKKVRQFRVALAVGANRQKKGQYTHLFKGFNKAVPEGTDQTRFAEVMPMSDVRQVLDEIANKVHSKLEEMKLYV